jgi:hypothetical protein
VAVSVSAVLQVLKDLKAPMILVISPIIKSRIPMFHLDLGSQIFRNFQDASGHPEKHQTHPGVAFFQVLLIDTVGDILVDNVAVLALGVMAGCVPQRSLESLMNHEDHSMNPWLTWRFSAIFSSRGPVPVMFFKFTPTSTGVEWDGIACDSAEARYRVLLHLKEVLPSSAICRSAEITDRIHC